MICLCPFCGYRVGRPIQDGISTCNHCQRVFDSSPFHRILSAAWLVRKQNLYNIDAVAGSCDLTPCELAVVEKFVVNEDYCHDDLLKVIDKKTCIDCCA